MDPLSDVYSGRDNTGGAVVFGKTPNELGAYIKQQSDIEKQQAKAKPDFDPLKDADSSKLGTAWDQDVPKLTEFYYEVLQDKKNYVKEKDPIKKAEHFRSYVEKKAKLDAAIQKSQRNQKEYAKGQEHWNADKNFLLGEDTPDKLESYRSASIWDRPDSPGVKVDSNIDLANKAQKRALDNLAAITTDYQPYDPTTNSYSGKKEKAFREDALDKRLDYNWDNMPRNERNGWKMYWKDAAVVDPHVRDLISQGKEKELYRDVIKTQIVETTGQKILSYKELKPTKGGSGDGTMEFKGGTMTTTEVKNADGTTEKQTTLIPKGPAKDLPEMTFETGKATKGEREVVTGRIMYITETSDGAKSIVIKQTTKGVGGLPPTITTVQVPFNTFNMSQIDKVTQEPKSYYKHIGKEKPFYGKKEPHKKVDVNKTTTSTKPKPY